MSNHAGVTIIGRVGKDPEVTATQMGADKTVFSVAVNIKKDAVQWFRVTAFGGLGKTCMQYVRKGMQVAVIGRMEPLYLYVNDNGDAGAVVSVTADNVVFLSRVEDEDEAF